MVGPQKREMSGIVLNYFYSVGEAIVGLLFWLYPNWVALQLMVSVPPLLFIGYYWIVPESVRWLLARKDYTKARKIIKKAAHVNGVELSEHIIQSFELKSPTHSENVRKLDSTVYIKCSTTSSLRTVFIFEFSNILFCRKRKKGNNLSRLKAIKSTMKYGGHSKK